VKLTTPEMIVAPTAKTLVQLQRKGELTTPILMRYIVTLLLTPPNEFIEFASANWDQDLIEIRRDVLIAIGKHIVAPRERLRKQNKERAERGEAQRVLWQALADGIWKRRPKLSSRAVGQLIDPDNFEYIRQQITKPGWAIEAAKAARAAERPRRSHSKKLK